MSASKKYQVFLSYKQTGEDGHETPDALMAKELYKALTDKGINVFFSSETLTRLGEADYSMAIDKALDAVSVLIAVGTSEKNLNSNWVKYEWESFYNDKLSGRKEYNALFSYIDRMSIQDLPRKLRLSQSFERSKTPLADICGYIENAIKLAPEDNSCPENCRVLTLSELADKGLSFADAEKAFSEYDKLLYPDMPSVVAGTPEQWEELYELYPDYSAAVVDDKYEIYGNYSLLGLSREQERLICRGSLMDSDLKANNTDDIYKKGFHFAYLINFRVDPSSESADTYKLLWDHFIEMLKKKAGEGVFFSKIYYKAFLAEQETKMLARGFVRCCKDDFYGSVYVLDMSSQLTLKVIDEELADIYDREFHKNQKEHRDVQVELQEVDALTAYMDLWKQIEDLWYQPEYCRLKRYFMEGKDIPENTMEYKKGLAVSEWIRDNLQYSEALLPYIPESQRESFETFKSRIYNSEIVRDSMKQYMFTTEEESDSNVIEGTVSVKALMTLAQVWMDIDKLFMVPSFIDYKQYFYDNRNSMPPEEDMEMCELIAVRILSVIRVAENQLRNLPVAYAESSYKYIDMLCSSAISQHIFQKFPYLREEIQRR